MSVHYKFKSALDFDTLNFDGLHISIGDFKKGVCQQKRFGKSNDFDLQVTNAQTKEVYTDDGALIPKNTSLIVARVPLTAHQKRIWAREAAASSQAISKATADEGQDHGHSKLSKAVDLSRADASEEDKIKAMMSQATSDYDPSNYIRIKGSGQVGEVPPTYRCFRCQMTGHWIKNCPLVKESGEPVAEVKKSTGIPRSFMVPVAGPLVPGAMMTPTGGYAVPAIDHEAYLEQKKEKPAYEGDESPVEDKPDIPEDLICSICEDLLTDAVMIPCCGNSFCDECIRSALLESEEHECPHCKDDGVSPDTLLPNRFLRTAVAKFRNETGYIKPLRMMFMAPEPVRVASPVKEEEEEVAPEKEVAEKKEPLLALPDTEAVTPDANLDSLSPSPPHRRRYHREDTPTHDEPPLPPEHHLPMMGLGMNIPPPSAYLAPPGVDDHFVPNYPPPQVPPSGPPPGNYEQHNMFRGGGPFFGGGGGGGRREGPPPDFGYYDRGGDRNRPQRQPRYDRIIDDPLEEFNRILKAKDEERRRRDRRDRSFSPRPMRRSPKQRSRSPKPRRSSPPPMPMKRRSPVKKFSRSPRSRSPIMHRGRSRSFTMSPSPSRHGRDGRAPLMQTVMMKPNRMSRSRSPQLRYPDRGEKHIRASRMEEQHRLYRRHEKERMVPREDHHHQQQQQHHHHHHVAYIRDAERVERLHREPERFEEKVEVPKKELEDARVLITQKKAKHETRHETRHEPRHEQPVSKKEKVVTPEPVVEEKHKEKEPKEKEAKSKEKKKRRESDGTKKKKHKDKDKEKDKKKKVKTHSKSAKKEEEKQQGEAPDTTTAEEETKEEVPIQAPAIPPKAEEKPEAVEKPENMPEPSKWEKSEDEGETSRDEPAKTAEEDKPVTTEVLKRAENAIFKKAINAIRPERKVYMDAKIEEIQVTVDEEGRKAEKRKSTEEKEIEPVHKKKHKKDKKKKKSKKKSETSSSGSSSDSEYHKKKKKKKAKKSKKKKHRSSDDSDSSSEEEKKSKKKKKKHKK